MGAVVLGGVTEIPRGRLTGWAGLVVVLAAVAYAARIAGGAPERNLLYHYSTAVGAVIQFGVIAVVLLVLAHGLDLMEVVGLNRPQSWPRGLGLAAAGLAAIWVVGLALSPFLDAGKDQGLVPDRWEPSHAGAYAANFAVVVLVAPLVEETVFRGFGMSAIALHFGPAVAVAVTALGWGLTHGLTAGLPILVAFGVILGVVRLRTGSVLPGMVTHATFNAIALVSAVTVSAAS